MRRPPTLALLAAALVAALAACANPQLVGTPAPPVEGGTWLASAGEPELEGRWVLYEFFAPT